MILCDYALEVGLHNISMFSAASRLGVSRRTIYRYFETKEHLLYLVYKVFYNDLVYEVAQRRKEIKASNSKERCIINSQNVVKVLLENKDKLKYIIEFDSSIKYDDVIREHASLVLHSNFMQELVKDAQKDGYIRSDKDPKEETYLFMDTIMALIYRYSSVNAQAYDNDFCLSIINRTASQLINCIFE